MSTYSTATANGPTAAEEPSGSTAQQAKDKAQETAQQATQQAKGRVRDQVDQRSTQAGGQVSSAAQDARSVSEELRKQGKDQPAKLVEQAADRAESLGDYLTRSDGETILRDVEDFGRNKPWAVIAGGLALGFAASRFLKASSTRRYESPRPTPSRSLTTGAPSTRTGLTAGDVDPLGGASRPAVPPVGTGTDFGAGGVSPVDGPAGPGFVPPARSGGL